MLRASTGSAFVVGCALALACGPSDRVTDTVDGDGAAGADAGPGGGGGGAAQQCNQMDLVFVVDDSGSMVEEQDNLAANFEGFIAVLDAYRTDSGEPLDYRVAVTTSGRDLDYTIAPDPVVVPGFPPIEVPPQSFSEQGDDGAFRQGCDMQRRWIERGDTDVSSTFSCVAKVGTGGPSIEMPLYTTQLALTERMSDGTNQGFLRDDALLAVVILSDEDDCSRPDNNFTVKSDQCDPEWPEQLATSDFVAFFDQLKGDRGRWATAVVAGPGPDTCSSEFGEAFDAKRLRQFVGQTGTNAVFSSICEGDLSSALADALETFAAACESFPVE